MTIEQYIEIEKHYQQEDLISEKVEIQQYLDYFRSISNGDLSEFCHSFEKRIDFLRLHQKSETEIGCCLIWLILASETRYNISKRDQLLSEFCLIADRNYVPFFEYYRQIFKATGYSFQSLQVEAESYFQKSLALAEAINYPCGIVRSLIGLGLTKIEMKNVTKAKEFLNQALEIAKTSDFIRSAQKIEFHLGKQKSKDTDSSVHNLLAMRREIVQLISENDLLFARQKLAKAEHLRRKVKLNRQSLSFYVLHAVVAGLNGKNRICRSILERLTDRVLKLEALQLLKARNYALDERMQLTIKLLEVEILEIEKTKTIYLDEIDNLNVRALLRTLSTASEPIEKCELFERIFGIKYDPVLHDIKLYRIIMTCRKLISDEVIVNHRGSYTCNSKKFRFVG